MGEGLSNSPGDLFVFVHESRLRHLLTAAHYHDPELHRLEVERLFLPAWHIVGTTSQLRRPGDFLTCDVLGRPLLVRNMDGEMVAFLNVCAHRHCRLTGKERGWSARLVCQYHGWEYDRDGRTGRIPDARCFRPWDRENAQLHKFRAERCGELIFVNLSESGPSLREFLGPYFDYCQTSFSAPWFLKWTWERHYEANWKLPIENSLESYHIPVLHQRTFAVMPEEKDCVHDLKPNWTTFRTPEPDTLATRFQAWSVRRMGLPLTRTYIHHHAHPHLTWANLDVTRLVQMVLPTSPTTCVHRVWLYTPRSQSWNPLSRPLAWLISWAVQYVSRLVIFEDAPIFAEAQRGLNVSPFPGVIGTREERVYAFQEYVLRHCAPEEVATPEAVGRQPSGSG